MLKILRNKKTAKKIWLGLAIIIVPAFAFWGFGSAVGSKKATDNIGKLFGKKVSALEFQDAVDAVRVQTMMQFGQDYTEAKKYLDFKAQAWERLILLHEVNARKIKVSDKEVIDLIEDYPFFQRKGRFDKSTYYRSLEYMRIQPRAFEESIRQNLSIVKLYDQITKDLKLSEDEVKKEYQKLTEELVLSYITSNPSEFEKNITATDQELKLFYEKNPAQFKEPLSFNLDYTASDSQEKIKELFSKLDKKTDFNKAAKELDLNVKESGFFTLTDPIPGIGWSPEVLELIQRLKPQEYSSPIQVDKNIFVLKLKERKESYIPEFDKIKNKVKSTLIKTESQKAALERIESCLKKLKELQKTNPKATDFKVCANEFGLKTGETASFKFGSYIEGIGSSDIFWMAASGLKDNDFSNVVYMPSGYYIVRVKNRSALDEKKFSSEKEDFSKRFLEQRKERAFTKFLEGLKIKAR